MSISMLSWGSGRIFEHPFRGTPYDDRVAKHLWIWFVVDDESQVVMGFKFAGCEWRLIEAYTSDRPDSLGFSDPEGMLLPAGPTYDCGHPLYCLVYQRVGDAPKCTQFS